MIVGAGGPGAGVRGPGADRVVDRRRGAGRSGGGGRAAPRGLGSAHAGRHRAGRRPGPVPGPGRRHDVPPWQLGRRLRAVVRPPPLPRVGEQLRRPRPTASPVWWWARKAARLGATEGGPADVHAARRHAGLDRRRPPVAARRCPLDGAAVVHSDSVELGRLDAAAGSGRLPSAVLAPDQLEAVAHGAGPARIIAPAGSGKTRVLTERYRHLLADRGYEREAVVALAYNKKAQEEMAARLPGLGARIQTLNAWGYGILSRALGRRPELLDEREVRPIVEQLVPSQAAAGEHRSDRAVPRRPVADPARAARPAGGGGERSTTSPAWPPPTSRTARRMRRRGAIDFDEQVFGAARGAAARRRPAAAGPGRPPPPPRRRAPGPHPGPRPARAAGRGPRRRRLRRRRRRPDHLRPRRRRPAVPRRLRDLLPGRRASTPSR